MNAELNEANDTGTDPGITHAEAAKIADRILDPQQHPPAKEAGP